MSAVAVAAAVILAMAAQKKHELHLQRQWLTHIDRDMMGSILRIGIPSACENSIFQLGRLVVVSMIALFGTTQTSANAVANTALLIGAKLIINFTETGKSTIRISKARPCCPIISVTNRRKTAMAGAFMWGVYSVLLKTSMPDFIEEMEVLALKIARDLGFKEGEPIIIAGGGVISCGASPYLKELAKKLNAPVTYTLMGKGAVPDGDPLCIGMLGMHGTYSAAKAILASDVIIALGTRFSDRVALNRDLFANGKKVIHIDIDNAEFDKNVKTSVRVLASVDAYLKAVLPLLSPRGREWMDEVETFERGEKLKVDTSIMAYKILKKASALAPRGNPVVADVGQHQMWTAQYFAAERPRQFLTSGGLGTMGYSMGGAIGAHFGTGKPVIVVVGDGCFNMNMNELSTAVTNNVPLVILLMNNSVLGMVRQWQKIFYERRFSQTTLNKKTDYVKFAESFGAKGMTIKDESEIDGVLKEAYSYAAQNSAPVLIDCRISCDENVLPMIKPGQTYDTQLERMEEN